MTFEYFNEALSIIARHVSTQVAINTVLTHFVGDIGKTVYTVRIVRCSPGVVHDLVNAGFLCSMTPEGLNLDKMP